MLLNRSKADEQGVARSKVAVKDVLEEVLVGIVF